MAWRHRHFLTLDPFTAEEILGLLDLAAQQKSNPDRSSFAQVLKNKVVGLFFEKPSLRTRLAFEVAIHHLGGSCLYFGPESGKLGVREPVKDLARVAARYLDGLVARTMAHETIEELARFCDKPVINGLSDLYHPCQALADLMTIRERLGRLKGLTIAYIGDANNVARSLALGAIKCGAAVRIAAPKAYAFPEKELKTLAPKGGLEQWADPAQAARDADVLYTDVWTSMGQEEETEKRRRDFKDFQINAALMARAPKAIVLHCLPAHRGEEITDEAIESPRSAIFDQAENRLHVQRALLCQFLG